MSAYMELPEFNDPLAKKRERVHYPSGARVIEVLYGAKDSEGNSVAPGSDADDGHGSFTALEIDGEYRLLLWQHSTAEGGKLEQGEHTLQELESSLRQKSAVLEEAREAMGAGEFDAKAVEEILAKFPEGPDMGTPREKELSTQLYGLRDKIKKTEERSRSTAENADKKKALIEKAKSVKEAAEFDKPADGMKALMEEWKKLGNAGEENDALWEEFNGIQKAYYDDKHAYMEKMFTERASEKNTIIEEAKTAVAAEADFETVHAKLEELLAKWKKVGSAGRQEDEKLWTAFQEVRNAFYAKRSEARKERDVEYKARREAKKELIKEAQSFAKAGDYGRAAADRMKAINEEWKKIGSAGRRDEEVLWKSLREAMDSFWQNKRSGDAGRHEQWIKSTTEAVERRRARIANISQNVDKLKERLATTMNEEKKAQIEGWIAENEEQISGLTAEVDRMEKELKRSAEKDAEAAAAKAAQAETAPVPEATPAAAEPAAEAPAEAPAAAETTAEAPEAEETPAEA